MHFPSKTILGNVPRILAVIACLALSAVANPARVEVTSYNQCSKLSPELSGACLENTGSRNPFVYYEVTEERDCHAFTDSAIFNNCLDVVATRNVFRVPLSKVDPNSTLREVTKQPIEQVASSTHTLVVLAAINLGITVVAIATTAFLYFNSID